VLLADAGYCSNDNLEALADGNLDALVATGRLSHDERVMARAERAHPEETRRPSNVWQDAFGQSRQGDYAGARRSSSRCSAR